MYKTQTRSLSQNDALLLLGIGSVLLLMGAPHSAIASSSGGGGLPYESWLETITSSITGPVAYAFMLIGIVGSGATLIFGGEINGFLRTLIYLVLVAAFLVGATRIMSGLFGHGALIV